MEAIADTLNRKGDPSGALVGIETRTGHIKAMVGGTDYDSSKFNLAAQGRRQPGSSFKTFVLAAAVERGIDPYSTYYESMPLSPDLPGGRSRGTSPPTAITTTGAPASSRPPCAATTRSTRRWPST